LANVIQHWRGACYSAFGIKKVNVKDHGNYNITFCGIWLLNWYGTLLLMLMSLKDMVFDDDSLEIGTTVVFLFKEVESHHFQLMEISYILQFC